MVTAAVPLNLRRPGLITLWVVNGCNVWHCLAYLHLGLSPGRLTGRVGVVLTFLLSGVSSKDLQSNIVYKLALKGSTLSLRRKLVVTARYFFVMLLFPLPIVVMNIP